MRLLLPHRGRALFWARLRTHRLCGIAASRCFTPAHPNIRAQLASAYALAGEPERAAAELAEARRLSSDDRFSSLTRLREVEDFVALVPKIRALFEATFFAGLRNAGMPEG
jgi:hypothetical protein